MSITLTKPELTELKPKIVVVGVGGAGGNAVNNMIRSELQGIEFIVANTDAQALSQSLTDRRLQLGIELTHGLGAGARPEIGEQAAREAAEHVDQELEGCHMAFITAGMGGGTGTGAAPVIANQAREKGILTVGVVTKPFQFEGGRRMNLAEQGIEQLQQAVDTLIVIPNQNLFRIANEKTTFADAFAMADRVLHSGVRGITDLMVMPGLINLDFADVRTVMMEMGKAMMGTGEAEGEKRALEAAESAIANPLLDDVSLKGAKGVLINITGGMDMTLFEVDEAANRIRGEVDPDANIIVGSTFDEELSGKLRVSVFATGIDSQAQAMETPVALHAGEVRRAAGESRVAAASPETQQTGEVIEMPQQRMAAAGGAAPAETAAAETTVAETEAAPDSAPAAQSGESEVAQNDDVPVDEPAPAQLAADAEPEARDDIGQAETPAAEIPSAESPTAAGQTDTPFIAPRPMRADGSEMPATGDPFAEAAMVNSRSEPAADNQKGPSLLDRVTGRARKPAQAERKEPEITKPKPAPKPEHKNDDMAFQFGENGTPAGDRASSDQEEDQLEIPAFLRRQAN